MQGDFAKDREVGHPFWGGLSTGAAAWGPFFRLAGGLSIRLRRLGGLGLLWGQRGTLAAQPLPELVEVMAERVFFVFVFGGSRRMAPLRPGLFESGRGWRRRLALFVLLFQEPSFPSLVR
jgi:hypothetical protein